MTILTIYLTDATIYPGFFHFVIGSFTIDFSFSKYIQMAFIIKKFFPNYGEIVNKDI